MLNGKNYFINIVSSLQRSERKAYVKKLRVVKKNIKK